MEKSAIWETLSVMGDFAVTGVPRVRPLLPNSAFASAEALNAAGISYGKSWYALEPELQLRVSRHKTYRKQVIREATKIDHAADLHKPAVMAEKESALC